ncbi:MAG TPA: glycosyltransferase family 39 protein, partial [Pseudomonadales bacterium]|nr:glycosyltransferase family 39 protein [Pseudomonadales bacterium]
MDSAGNKHRFATLLALAVPICSLLLMLFLRPLAVPDEGRYADVARLMLVNQDYVVPRLNGLPFFHKPPMLYWFESASFHLFGIHDWAARLAPALHGIALLLGLHLFNKRLFGNRFANRCSLLLGTSLPWLLGSQYVNHDMVVASWISLTIMAFAAGLELNSAKLMRFGFLAAACGVLSKGLIGIVLPGMVLFFWIALTQQWRKLLSVPWLSGVLLFLALGLPWFILMEQRYPGFFDYFFIEQQFHRFTGKNFNNVQPWWFYWVVMLLL